MNQRPPSSPTDIADAAKSVGKAAAQAAKSYAQEGMAIASDTGKPVAERAEDAKALSRRAAETARGFGSSIADMADGVSDVANMLAGHAAEVVSAEFDEFKEAMRNGREGCAGYARAHPIRSAVLAAAVTAIVVRLAMAAIDSGRSRRYRQY